MTCAKPCRANGPAASVLRQSLRVAGHEHRQLAGLAKQRMREQVVHLPVPLLLGQAQVPVHELQRTLGRVDHGQLRAARLLAPQPQRDLMARVKRPPRQNQVAVAAGLEPHGGLPQVGHGVEVPGQQVRLIVKAASGGRCDRLPAGRSDRGFLPRSRRSPAEGRSAGLARRFPCGCCRSEAAW